MQHIRQSPHFLDSGPGFHGLWSIRGVPLKVSGFFFGFSAIKKW
jgi:hypothetical protein